MFNLGKTNAGLTLVQTNLLSFLTIIPKAIFGLIGLAHSFGMSAVAATGLKGILEALKIDPIMLAISAIVAIGYGAVKVIDALTTSFNEQKETVANLTSKYQSLKSEVENLSNITAPTEADKLKLQILQAELTLQQDLLKTETERLLLKQSKKVENYETRVGRSPAPKQSISRDPLNLYQKDIETISELDAQIRKTDASTLVGAKTIDQLTNSRQRIIDRTNEYKKALLEEAKIYQTAIENGVELTDEEESRLKAILALILGEEDLTNATQDGNDSLEEQIGTVSG
ncbi:MAG: hypothetical protein RR313_12805, partial [Anaerovoracaceae bacterium]